MIGSIKRPWLSLMLLCLMIFPATLKAGSLSETKPSGAETYAYLEVFVGHNINSQGWVGDTPSGAAAGIHHDMGKDWYGEFEIRHQSNIDRGAPFNNKYETWVDTIGITIGRKFRF